MDDADSNPYAVSKTVAVATDGDAEVERQLVQALRSFRREARGLGALYCLLGLSTGATLLIQIVGSTSEFASVTQPGGLDWLTSLTLLPLGITVLWRRKVWAIRMSIAIYLALMISAVSTLGPIRLIVYGILSAIVLAQAFRLLRLARQLGAAGIPINCRAEVAVSLIRSNRHRRN